MAITISGTDGIVGAGFTVDASGVSVTAGVGTFSSLNAAASGLTGALPAISGANLTNLPAANLTGTLPAISGANLTGITAGITMFDQWRYTASPQGDQDPLSGSWERNDTNFDKIGSGMSESSGIFTFPTTGIYQIHYKINFYSNGNNSAYTGAYFFLSTDSGSNYTQISYGYDQLSSVSGYYYGSAVGDVAIDVTNASTFRVRLKAAMGNQSVNIQGNSTQQITGITFTRMGDT